MSMVVPSFRLYGIAHRPALILAGDRHAGRSTGAPVLTAGLSGADGDGLGCTAVVGQARGREVGADADDVAVDHSTNPPADPDVVDQVVRAGRGDVARRCR